MTKKLTPEEQETWETLSTPPPAPPKLDPIIIPMIRRVMPQSIASELVGVQPMSESLGEAFKLKVRYEDGREQEDN